MFVFVLLCLLRVHSSFAIILKRKRKLFALLLLSYSCIVTINVLWLFLTLSWVGLHCVIVVFPDHTRLLFIVCLKVMSAYFIVCFNKIKRDGILLSWT